MDSFNKAAGELFASSPDEFFTRVRESVDLSKTQLYTNYENTSFKVNDNLLQFSPFTAKHMKIKDSLKEVCEDQGLSLE